MLLGAQLHCCGHLMDPRSMASVPRDGGGGDGSGVAKYDRSLKPVFGLLVAQAKRYFVSVGACAMVCILFPLNLRSAPVLVR